MNKRQVGIFLLGLAAVSFFSEAAADSTSQPELLAHTRFLLSQKPQCNAPIAWLDRFLEVIIKDPNSDQVFFLANYVFPLFHYFPAESVEEAKAKGLKTAWQRYLEENAMKGPLERQGASRILLALYRLESIAVEPEAGLDIEQLLNSILREKEFMQYHALALSINAKYLITQLKPWESPTSPTLGTISRLLEEQVRLSPGSVYQARLLNAKARFFSIPPQDIEAKLKAAKAIFDLGMKQALKSLTLEENPLPFVAAGEGASLIESLPGTKARHEALSCYQQLFECLNDNNDPPWLHESLRALTLSRIGMIYFHEGNREKAREALEKGLKYGECDQCSALLKIIVNKEKSPSHP